MKKSTFLTLLAAVILSGLSAQARKVPAEALGTVSYDIHYNWGIINTKVADAAISFEKEAWQGHAAYHSHAAIKSTPVFSLFIGSDYIADTWIAQSDLEPLFFINPFKKNGQEGKFEYTYDASHKVIASVTVLDPNQPAEEKDFPYDGHTMDLLSLLHYIRFVDISEGSKPIKLSLLMGGKAFAAKLSHKGVDEEKYPGQKAEHLLLEMTERGLMDNGSGNELQIWRSAGEDRRLFGLEAPLSVGFMSVSISQ